MKKIKIIFLITGITILILLFKAFGLEATINKISAIGWRFLIIVLIFLFTNIFLTIAWFILIPYPVKKTYLYKFIMARIAGDATTSINAIGAFAGEPLKALYVKDILPFKVGLASVILDRIIKIIAGILLSITGIFTCLFIVDIPIYFTVIALVIGFLLLLFLFIILKNQKYGFFENILTKIPDILISKIMNSEKWAKIRSIDKEISYIFSSRENLNHFYISLSLHYFTILITCTLEIYLIARYLSIEGDFNLYNSFFVFIFGFVLTSLIFFMPANIGTSEGSYSIALSLLGFDPIYGLSIGIIRRLRTFVWSGIGIVILFYAGLIKKEGGIDGDIKGK